MSSRPQCKGRLVLPAALVQCTEGCEFCFAIKFLSEASVVATGAAAWGAGRGNVCMSCACSISGEGVKIRLPAHADAESSGRAVERFQRAHQAWRLAARVTAAGRHCTVPAMYALDCPEPFPKRWECAWITWQWRGTTQRCTCCAAACLSAHAARRRPHLRAGSLPHMTRPAVAHDQPKQWSCSVYLLQYVVVAAPMLCWWRFKWLGRSCGRASMRAAQE